MGHRMLLGGFLVKFLEGYRLAAIVATLTAMWLDKLASLRNASKVRAVGVISGTSADAIDVAVCDFDLSPTGISGHTILAFEECSYTENTHRRIKAAEALTIQGVAELDLVIGEEFASAIRNVCSHAQIDIATIDLVGSHGQTVYHHSRRPGAKKATLQLGCADTIAAALNVPVLHDFRRKDIALGGEGAPLTPFSDYVLYRTAGKRRAILNLGGIANITVLADAVDDVVGFDTGPANAPLDRLASIISNGALSFDKDGLLASAGTVDPKLLGHLLSSDAYVQQPPPKSTGFEMYGDSFVRALIAQHGGADVHLLATVTEFVAQSVAEALRQFVPKPLDELIVAGGGAQNPTLMAALKRALKGAQVTTSDAVGIPSAAREAIGFAVLGVYGACGWTSSIPRVTGASQSACLGKLATPP